MLCRTPATTTSSLRGESTPTPTVGGLEQRRQSTWRESMLFDTVARLLARESLSSDAHMACLMSLSRDNRVCIPVNLLLSHPIISSLFMSSEELLRQLRHLVANDLLELDERRMMIFPLMKAKRRTLIIRNPRDDEESYRRFLQERCPLLANETDAVDSAIAGITTVRTPYSSDIYITFRTEQLAADVALWLMNNDYLPGERLQVAIKNESQYSASQLLPAMTEYRYSTDFMLSGGGGSQSVRNEPENNRFSRNPRGGAKGFRSPQVGQRDPNWRDRYDSKPANNRGSESQSNWRRVPSAWPTEQHKSGPSYHRVPAIDRDSELQRNSMALYDQMPLTGVQPPSDPKEFPPLGMQ